MNGEYRALGKQQNSRRNGRNKNRQPQQNQDQKGRAAPGARQATAPTATRAANGQGKTDQAGTTGKGQRRNSGIQARTQPQASHAGGNQGIGSSAEKQCSFCASKEARVLRATDGYPVTACADCAPHVSKEKF